MLSYNAFDDVGCAFHVPQIIMLVDIFLNVNEIYHSSALPR